MRNKYSLIDKDKEFDERLKKVPEKIREEVNKRKGQRSKENAAHSFAILDILIHYSIVDDVKAKKYGTRDFAKIIDEVIKNCYIGSGESLKKGIDEIVDLIDDDAWQSKTHILKTAELEPKDIPESPCNHRKDAWSTSNPALDGKLEILRINGQIDVVKGSVDAHGVVTRLGKDKQMTKEKHGKVCKRNHEWFEHDNMIWRINKEGMKTIFSTGYKALFDSDIADY